MSISENTADGEFELACKHCGERNPPRFAICWNCGQSLEDAERVKSTEPPNEDDRRTLSFQSISKHLADHQTDWCELVAVLLATFVYHILRTSIIQRVNISTGSLTGISWYVGWSMLLWILIRHDSSSAQPVPLRESKWIHEVLFAVLILAADFALSYVVAILAHDMRLPIGQPPVFVEISGLQSWMSHGVLLFFAAAYEEMMYRVYLQSKLESLLGDTVLSIAISAMIFAASHGYPPAPTLRIFAMGALYGTIYHYARRLPRLVLAHWMHNLLVSYMSQL